MITFRCINSASVSASNRPEGYDQRPAQENAPGRAEVARPGTQQALQISKAETRVFLHRQGRTHWAVSTGTALPS